MLNLKLKSGGILTVPNGVYSESAQVYVREITRYTDNIFRVYLGFTMDFNKIQDITFKAKPILCSTHNVFALSNEVYYDIDKDECFVHMYSSSLYQTIGKNINLGYVYAEKGIHFKNTLIGAEKQFESVHNIPLYADLFSETIEDVFIRCAKNPDDVDLKDIETTCNLERFSVNWLGVFLDLVRREILDVNNLERFKPLLNCFKGYEENNICYLLHTLYRME